MKAKTKSRAEETKRLLPEMEASDMTAIDLKINSLLIAEGYRLTNTERINRSGFNKDVNVNHMEYLRNERERVFVVTHEPVTGSSCLKREN